MPDEIEIRSPTMDDGAAMWRLAAAAGELDVNSSYAYLLWCRDFSATSVVAVAPDGTGLAGFITGYMRPDDPSVLLVWQVAVSPEHRRKGIAAAMLDEMVAVSARHGGTHLETTVTPGNVPSRTMFAALAERHSARSIESELMVSGHFPDEHEPERLIRIGPFR